MEIFHGSSFSFKDIITGINFWFQRSLPNEAKNNLRFVKIKYFQWTRKRVAHFLKVIYHSNLANLYVLAWLNHFVSFSSFFLFSPQTLPEERTYVDFWKLHHFRWCYLILSNFEAKIKKEKRKSRNQSFPTIFFQNTDEEFRDIYL